MQRHIRQLSILLLAVAVVVSISVFLVVRDSGDAPAVSNPQQPGLAPTENTSVTDSAAAAAGVTRVEGIAVRDAYTATVQRAPTAVPTGGGRSENAHITDTIQFVVRDASGNIKQGK